MVAPTFSVLSEIHLQFIEHTRIYTVLLQNNILGYFRYVDDILIVFDPNHSNIIEFINYFNSLHPKLQFTAKTEKDCTLNYLHLSINRTPTGLNAAIF